MTAGKLWVTLGLLAAGLWGQEYAPRADYGARLEPRGVIQHGAGQDPDAFDRYRGVMAEGRQPLLYMHYIGLKDLRPNWAETLRRKLLENPEHFLMPQIGLSMTYDGRPGEAYEAQVAAGEMDQQIEYLVAGLKSLTVPVYLRIGYEFNGLSWNGYLPESYKEAFRRIADRLRAEGPGLEVATVWCAAIDGTRNFEDFYPGDEYVDWYGIDIFAARHFADADVQRFVESAAARRKPVMLGETTPRQVGAQRPEAWEEWFQPLFAWMQRTPQVKQFHYINWEWAGKAEALKQPGWANWGDARLETELAAPVRERFLAELEKPGVFQHAGTESEFRRSLGPGEGEPVAPEPPAGLAWREDLAGGVGVAWEAPAEESGVEVARYYIYRDGALVDFARQTQFVDEAVKAGDTVEYRVATMTRAGELSERSEPLLLEVGAVVRAADGFAEGIGAWQLDAFHENAKGQAGVEEEAAVLEVQETSGTGWHLQFRRFAMLHEGLRYRLKVRAKADREAAVRLWLQEASAPNAIYANRALALRPEWQEFEFEVTAPAARRAAVSFILGGLERGTKVWVDEVRMTELP